MATSNLDVQSWYAHFLGAYEGDVAGLFYQDILKVYTSESITDNFPLIEEMAGLEAFPNTGRTEKDIVTATSSISKSTFEDNVTMRRVDYVADRLGLFQDKIEDMAINAKRDWNDRVVTLLSGGASTTIYDGVNFFSASHPLASGTQTNIATSANVAALKVGIVASPTNVEASAIVSQMLGFMVNLKNYAGLVANGAMRKMTILVGTPAHFSAFAACLATDFSSAGVINPLLGLKQKGYVFDVELVPGIANINSGANVYFCRGDARIKPFIGTVREEEFVPSFEGIGSYYQNQFDKVRFGIVTDRGFGYGRYQGCVQATLSTT
jgi:hypothetical protein